MSRALRDLIKDLAHTFEQEDGCALDLWTWLPSYKIAMKYHKDYATDFRPSIASILEEASLVLAERAGYMHSIEEWEEFLQCPCGKGCEQEKQHGEEERG